MATLVLGAVGSAIGGSIGGAILGVSAATIGGFIGSTVGSVVDSWIVSSLAPAQRVEGQRLDSLRITSSTEGAVIPRLYGRMRIGGNIIWATDFREETKTTTQGGGKGGGGGKVRTTEYLYYASFAVALCEGPITGIGRIWADGKPLDMTGITWRWYPGDETQTADPFIAAKMGAANTPAYRGTAYVVFEELPLGNFGNRLPQLSFEVFRPLADPDTAEGLVKAVTMIPASGEFTYATETIRKSAGGLGGTTSAENLNALPDEADIVVALDRLQAMAPAVESVSLVVAWFGNDLRAGNCTIKSGVEVATKVTSPRTWTVNGVSRANAHLVSTDDEGRPVYGGTPADFAVVQAIRELKARGLRVTFYPFILMDVPPGNDLLDPWSEVVEGLGQPPYPWRGRITCYPAPGRPGTPDQTAAAATQVAAFFGSASPSDFAVSGETVSWTGAPDDWGLRRMILHYAHLCAVAGGVDAFLIGSEMRGLTTIRDSASTYPAVQAFRDLAADVRSILGAGTKISYAADWSEYFGHQPQDGSEDVFFHLDPLWSDANIDFIGIDNYMPLSDWRDGFDHLDAQAGWPAIHDRAYLQSNIAGGEGFDWYYTDAGTRADQLRTPITDGAAGKPWVFRYKDLRGWWSNPHYNRPGGVEAATPTAWVPESKPIWFTEFGCPAVDRGTNQPNVFFDPKSSESFVPYFSRGWRDDAIQRAYLEATLLFWADPANNPVSSVYGGRMVHVPECAAWTWDARPYPWFPESGVWTDGPNWRLGHWLTGRLGSVSLAALVRHLCLRAGLPEDRIDVSGLWGAVEGYVIGALESPRASISTLARHFGFDAIETEGVIRFVMRGRASVATLAIDDLVASREGEAFELTRGQETELPQALKWQVARADEDYDAALVEARRITVDTTRIASESFPMAIPPEEAERRCRRALMEAWIGRESGTFRLPPSKLALDPADVIRLAHDGREVEFRLVSVADAEARGIEAVRQDRAAYDLPPGDPRPASLASPVVFGAPEVVLMDLPQISEDQPAHRPLVAAHAVPWPGEIAVFRSPTLDGFELLSTFGTRARIGTLVFDFYPGPTSRFDLGNQLVVDLLSGTLESVTDLALFGGANALAVESAAGVWEIVQAGAAELLAPGRYRLTRLLRGQRGTEHAMGSPAPAGARVVVLDAALASLPIAEADLGLPWNWRVGPAARAVTDGTYVQQTFTPAGVGLRPFSVVHVEQPWRRSRTPGDLTIRWTRRSRALVADAWEQVEVPLAEDLESYEVEILDGAAVKRTLTSSTTSVLYTAAQQIADWGAPLGPGQTLAIRIFQLSNRVGRGTPATVILQF
ncbi:Putative phage tail protein/GTA TIM-barrel-like domain protein [Rubellimicrobium thermophilum DSM 16684]|uniref:Putative phage tail protein/GTA TIM-barrel-like domain protein n=1 Tax=Rubellimicrobium thermophilum DSM 16684 TaxID=1123069 RepID=S9R209_9RHOB|nr:glycoside hydrolase TIM-barrel-like domain-containing protein [Rubellimicrobium thermophilum]EPX87686.1 Putative phage tail protein/GTA TIM-barrel-like domain protein [Rubellimicrobium thermophilum DSM 16684]